MRSLTCAISLQPYLSSNTLAFINKWHSRGWWWWWWWVIPHSCCRRKREREREPETERGREGGLSLNDTNWTGWGLTLHFVTQVLVQCRKVFHEVSYISGQQFGAHTSCNSNDRQSCTRTFFCDIWIIVFKQFK